METGTGEFIDIHNRKAAFEKALEKLKHDTTLIPENKKLAIKFIEDARLGKTVKNRAKKKIGYSRCLKYIIEVRKLSGWFGKPFDAVTVRDMEKVIGSLEEDKYKAMGADGERRNYSDNSKLDFKKAIRKLFRWLHGESKKFYDLTSWIDMHETQQEIPALSREEVERMANECDTRDKTIILVLFDSGARIEELMNVRLGDITKKEDGGYYMLRIRISKTKPRTISVPICTQVLDNWLGIHPDKGNPSALLFPVEYDAVRMMLRRVGARILKKHVYPHLLRHSSATYYCHKLNQYQLCYRYGWSMASAQPARYIDREGIREEETAELIRTDDVNKLKKAVQETNENYARLREENESLRKLMTRIAPTARIVSELVKDPEVRKAVAKTTERLVARGEIDASA
jgi:integrase